MITVLQRTPSPCSWAVGPPRLLAGLDTATRLDWRAHLAVHGPVPGTDPDHLLAAVAAGRLTGRGGAGFPLAAKLRALPETPRAVVVNGVEGEPGSDKDRTLLRRSPHLVLDGALAVGAPVTVAVRDEQTADTVRQAIAERPDGRRARVAVLVAGLVGGEARALVRALRGGPPRPPSRRTPPAATGSLVSNAETFAQLAVLLRLGPHRYAETGTATEPGTTLLTIGGAVARPGVMEIPIGTPLGIVLATAGAPEHPQAIVLGGFHGAWLPPAPTIRLSREGAAAAGGTLGAGVLLVLDENTCALGELASAAAWLAGESAQQCGPCRFGLPALADDVAALVAGRSGGADALEHARSVTGRGACAHPDGTARFVASGVRLLRDEISRHRAGGCGRPVLNQAGTP